MRATPFLTVLLILAVLALAAATGHAADTSPGLADSPEQQVDAYLRDLSARIALSPEETAAMRPILIAQAAKRQDLARARLAANPGMAGMLALREDMRAVTRETDDKLAAVLSPEKMEQLRNDRAALLAASRAQARQLAEVRPAD
jgi:hypothetical protein